MKPQLVRGRSGQWSVVDLAEPFDNQADYGLRKVGSHFENQADQGLVLRLGHISKIRLTKALTLQGGSHSQDQAAGSPVPLWQKLPG